jgi:hypothetical protein
MLRYKIKNSFNIISVRFRGHGLNTRSKNQFYIPTANISTFQKGTMFTGIRLFNRLPRTIQSLRKDRNSFKNNLFSYLMNNSFYTVDDFFGAHSK